MPSGFLASQLSRALLCACLLAPSLARGQGYCPPIDFLSAREFRMYGNSRLLAPLILEPDRSYTQYPHNYSPPYRRFPGISNAQDQFAACLPAARNPGPLLPVTGRNMGEGSAYTVMFPDAGSGLAAGGWTALNGDAVQWSQLNANYEPGPRMDYPVGERTTQLPGDFNGDGRPDVAVLGFSFPPANEGFVSVLLSNADGTLQQPIKTDTGMGSLPLSAAEGDYDADGKLDLVVVLQKSVVFLRGRGDGTFDAPAVILAVTAFAVHSVDFNGDGKPDLAVADRGTDEAVVLLGNGNGTFAVKGRFYDGPQALYITSGDFNKDGSLDLAVAGFLGVTVLPGNGDGTFGAARHWALGHQPKTIVVTDFNRDGALDIVAGEGFDQVLMPVVDTGYMGVLLGNGDGTFIGAELFLTPGLDSDIALADFNGDGRGDAVTARQGVVWMADGNGSFSQTRVLGGRDTVAAGDFNHDGLMDVAIADSSAGNSVAVHLGNGDGTFQNPVRIPAPALPTRMVATDFNADGRTDLAVLFDAGGGGASGVLILRQTANGVMVAAGQLAAGMNPRDLAAGDFNGDERMDLAVTDNGEFASESEPGQLLVFLGRGDGTFEAPVLHEAGMNPDGIAAGDLNDDGRDDLAVTTGGPSFTDFIALYYGQEGGSVTQGPKIPTEFGPGSPLIDDFSGDGNQDIVLTHCCGETQPGFLLGNGDGTVQDEVFFSGGADPVRLVKADVNLDGKPDLAVLHSSFGNMGAFSVFLNISADPAPFVNVSAASFDARNGVAPDSIVTAYGPDLAGGSESAVPPNLEATLAGVTVKVEDAEGVEHDAGLYGVVPIQVNYLMPPETALGRALVTVGGANPKTADVIVNRIAPSVFLINADGLAAAQLVRVHDGVQTSEDVFVVDGGQVVPRLIEVPDAPDVLVLILYGTGIRNRAELTDVTVTIGGIEHRAVAYAGPHSIYPGLDQVNVTLLRVLQGKGLVDVVLKVEGLSANTVKLEFQ